MRFKGDAVGLMVLVYLIAMFVVIALSVMMISNLDWSKKILDIFKS